MTGTTVNRSAIGADILIYANGKWQTREVNAQSGFSGQSSFVQHFGLGKAEVVDSIIVRWPGGAEQYLTNVAVNQILGTTETVSVRVSGGVFYDLNNNCRKDQNETMVPGAALQISNRNCRYFSDDKGSFSVALGPGSYSISLVQDGKISSSCGPVSFTIDTAAVTNIFIPAVPVCSLNDAGLIMGGTAIRKGFTNNLFSIVASNNGRQTIAWPVVKLKMPATVSLISPNIPYNSVESVVENNVVQNIYVWKLSPLNVFEAKRINFNTGNSTLQIGDTIPIMGWIEPVEADCNPGDNAIRQVYKVVGAIDPNDLQVSPVGYGPQGYIQPQQVLTYTIRFQNTGTHPAESVTITDELPEGLNMQSLKVVTCSVPACNVNINGNTVVFHMENVFLQDSVSDPQGSQGFIIFTIKPENNILPGTRLVNRANIRFDQYAPQLTNKTVNTIQSAQLEEEMIEVKTYPNPAMDVIYFSLQHKFGKEYTDKVIIYAALIDVSGKVVLSWNLMNGKEYRVDLPVWLNGFYFLKLTDSYGKCYTKKVMIKER